MIFFNSVSGNPCRSRDMLCIRKTGEQYFASGVARQCNCPLQCNQRSYPYSLSQSSFSQLYINHTSKLPNLKGKIINMAKINHEVTFLDISFSTLNYIDIQTKPGYSAFILFCQIGGTFGLILGATILTICEILQALVPVSVHLAKGCSRYLATLGKKS